MGKRTLRTTWNTDQPQNKEDFINRGIKIESFSVNQKKETSLDAWWCHRRGQVAPMRQWDLGEETPIYKRGEGRRKETKRIRWRTREKSGRKEKGLLAGRYGGHGRISEILRGETRLSSPPPLDVIYSGTATLSEGDGARDCHRLWMPSMLRRWWAATLHSGGEGRIGGLRH